MPEQKGIGPFPGWAAVTVCSNGCETDGAACTPGSCIAARRFCLPAGRAVFRSVFIFGCTVFPSRRELHSSVQGATGRKRLRPALLLTKMVVFSFFFPEINDSEGHPSSSHQTLKGTSKWATSLENLLEDPEGVKRFRVAMLTMGISTNQN